MALEKTLESPLDCKEIQPVHPRRSVLGVHWKDRYFGHLMLGANSFEKTPMLGKIEGRRRRGQHRMSWLDDNKHAIIMHIKMNNSYFPNYLKDILCVFVA